MLGRDRETEKRKKKKKDRERERLNPEEEEEKGHREINTHSRYLTWFGGQGRSFC